MLVVVRMILRKAVYDWEWLDHHPKIKELPESTKRDRSFCSSQLGHSVEMFHRKYAKWLNGDRNALEMEKLNQVAGLRVVASK